MTRERKYYSDEDLLEILREVYELSISNKKSMSVIFKEYNNLPSKAVYDRRFGGTNNALILLGLKDAEKDYDKFTDVEIVNLVLDFKDKNGNLVGKDLNSKNNLPSINYIKKRFGSLKVFYTLCGIDVKSKTFNTYRNITKTELINYLHLYYNKFNKVPTTRDLEKVNYPSDYHYTKTFGSYKNALEEADLLKFRNDLHQFCETYTDEELLDKLREYMKNKNRIPTGSELREIKDFSFSTYDRRFGSVFNAFKLIGYDIEDQRTKEKIDLEKDMIDKYREIQKIINRTPSSRDIEEFSRNRAGYYSMSSYEFHFGSVYKLQELCGFDVVRIGMYRTRQELIDDLIDFANELDRTPTQTEVMENKKLASMKKYCEVFGTFRNAIFEAGLEPVSKVHFSKNNDKCFSVYELRFNDMLIENEIKYKKEVYYKELIPNFERRYRIDYKIEFQDKVYYVEIFGLFGGNKDYDIKTAEKIKLCKDNNIPLIEFYPEHFYTTIHGDLYSQLIIKIEQYELLNQPVNV